MMLELELMRNRLSNAIERGLRAKAKLLEDSDFGIINKKEIKEIMADVRNNNKKNFNNNNNKKNNNKREKDFGSKQESRVEAPEMCGRLFEYQMGRALAETIITEDKSRRHPQEVLCEYVNTQLGLMGYCVKVFVTAN